jgi:hypothetical protein
VADELRKNGMEVRMEDGEHGEFKVEVDGQTVAQKSTSLPSVEQVVESVRTAA